MKMRTVLSAFSLLVLFVACRQNDERNAAAEEAEKAAKLAEILPGTWETVSLQVKVNSVDNINDSTYVFAVNEEKWIETLGVPPSRAFFEPENRYRVEHRDLNGELNSQTRGMWNVFGDTLMMVEPNVSYQYYVSIRDGLATFQTGIDWDGDGWEDDEYTEVKRKISVSTE